MPETFKLPPKRLTIVWADENGEYPDENRITVPDVLWVRGGSIAFSYTGEHSCYAHKDEGVLLIGYPPNENRATPFYDVEVYKQERARC